MYKTAKTEVVRNGMHQDCVCSVVVLYCLQTYQNIMKRLLSRMVSATEQWCIECWIVVGAGLLGAYHDSQ